MWISRRAIGATAVVTLTLQVAIVGVGAITLCGRRQHTHGGMPAPDCPMHAQAAGVPQATGHHHEMSGPTTTPAQRQISCWCPSDALSFLIGSTAVVSERFAVWAPSLAVSMSGAFIERQIGLRAAPLVLPPRPSASS